MKKKILAGILALATLFVCTCTAISCAKKDKGTGTSVEQNAMVDNTENGFSTELESTQHIQLLAVTPLMATVGSNYVSQTLEAVVYPETAENKKVDWSVAWGDSSNTENVTDYVTVTPSSDGSTTATVTCYKEFSGDIIITVTTRESGYTADCVVTFVGIPTEIKLLSPYSQIDGGYYLSVGEEHKFNVFLSNPFDSVGGEYQDVVAFVNGVGTVLLSTKEHYIPNDAITWRDSANREVSLESLKNNFLTVDYADGVLTVKTLKTIESYYGGVSNMDGGRTKCYTDCFKEFVTDCYFTVTLIEKTSGITKTVNIRFDDSVVTGVGITSGELLF